MLQQSVALIMAGSACIGEHLRAEANAEPEFPCSDGGGRFCDGADLRTELAARRGHAAYVPRLRGGTSVIRAVLSEMRQAVVNVEVNDDTDKHGQLDPTAAAANGRDR